VKQEEWRRITEEDGACDHWWSGHFINTHGELHTWANKCTHPAKFRSGYQRRCGYHTPGYGRKGPGRVNV
jgi:hypothetical protein